MKLPNSANALIEEKKLVEYVLNLDHPIGRHHAILFRDLLGIAQSDWMLLKDAVYQAAQSEEATPGKPSRHGQSPDGLKTVLAVWLVSPADSRPRLITCYVE